MLKKVVLLLLVVTLVSAAAVVGRVSLTQTGTEEARVEAFGRVFALRFGGLSALRDAGRLWLNALPSASSATEEKGTERFLFEEIAVNGEIPLGADDPERIFGMEANPATRFVTRGNASAFALSLSEVPPAERGLVYAVFDAMDPLARTTAERDARLTFPIKDLLAMRVLRNRDAILALRAAGNLDRPHLIALLFDDLGLPPAATNKEAFDVLYDAIQSIASKDLADRPELFSVVQAAIQLNGARKDEAIAAARANGPVPPTPYLSGLACSLTALDGTARPGLEQMKSDLCRPWMPVFRDGRNVLPDDRNRFVVRFPGEAPIAAEPGATTQPVVARSLREIVDRITDLCGNVHPKQIFAVGFALSQSATSRIDKAFVDRGVLTTEHSPVTFALSKDAETGAVTIRYSEPEGFPFRFHWETTIRPDGSGTSTQLVVENS